MLPALSCTDELRALTLNPSPSCWDRTFPGTPDPLAPPAPTDPGIIPSLPSASLASPPHPPSWTVAPLLPPRT